MPMPMIKRGSKITPRSRNKDGKIRKKRSDVGKKHLLVRMEERGELP